MSLWKNTLLVGMISFLPLKTCHRRKTLRQSSVFAPTHTHIHLLRNNIVKLFICPLGECGSNGEAVRIHYSLPTSQFPGPYFPINRCLVGGKMSAESQRRKVFNFKEKKNDFPNSVPPWCLCGIHFEGSGFTISCSQSRAGCSVTPKRSVPWFQVEACAA